MRIEAATLAGGEVNQDYYAYGETYALVLDGASSFLPEQTSIDTVTYVKALGDALAIRLESCHLNEIPDVVATAIYEIADRYRLTEDNAPNSTVVVAKWTENELATYVLGDSTCLIFGNSYGVDEITDNRISKFGNEIRNKYKNRLICGAGFDKKHKNILEELQIIQKNHRNIEGGYWIAGSLPEAGKHGLENKMPLSNVEKIILCTDGGLASFVNNNKTLKQMIIDRYNIEKVDSTGRFFPRSKIHDDKTIILIEF